MLRYLTAGESHGKAIIAILEGVVSGLKIDAEDIDTELARRMQGYGRGGRMKIEKDAVQILSGVKGGLTLGSPITLLIENKDFSIEKLPPVFCPRPGHADLAGALKYNHKDIRNVLERASARDTAGRVGAGAVCKLLLGEFDIEVFSHVILIGGVDCHTKSLSFEELKLLAEKSPVRCADKAAGKLMCEEIDKATEAGDTLGGAFEIIVRNVPPGLGSFAQWDRKLDGNIARALMSIQGIKCVGIGAGAASSEKRGSQFHDGIFYDRKKGFLRKTNNAGGIEGGVSNGEDILLKVHMKPIATLGQPLSSVDIKTKEEKPADVQRADVCAVPAAAVVGEAVVAFEIANAMAEKFGGDSLEEMKRNYDGYLKQIQGF